MFVFLKWSLSSHDSYPFCFDIKDNITIGELCKMVLRQNNQWHGNPTFSIVKIYDEDKKLLDNTSTIGMSSDDRYFIFVAG